MEGTRTPERLAGNTVVRRLDLVRENRTYVGALCMALADPGELNGLESTLLSEEELLRFRDFPVEKRRHTFLNGRRAAKLALGELLEGVDPREIRISAGVFTQPVVEHPGRTRLCVSLSHTHAAAAAVAFPEAHPIGIDVEEVHSGRAATMATQFTEAERGLLPDLPLDLEVAHTLLWTLKEGLSKVLRCGMMAPFPVLEVDHLEVTPPFSACTFGSFHQYKGLALIFPGRALSVVLPKHTDVDLSPFHAAAADLDVGKPTSTS